MIARGAGIVVLAVLGAGLVSAAPAGARRHLVAVFDVKGAHGYEIKVAAHRAGLPLDMRKADRRAGKVTVMAQKVSESESGFEGGSASYTVPARFNKHRIRANLGRFGKMRLRFGVRHGYGLPPARAAAQRRRIAVCGQTGFYVPGEFRGSFRFHGEGGYTSARAHRIHGQLRRDGPVRCSGHERVIELRARSGSTRFIALHETGFALTSFSAWTRERSGRVEIARKARRLAAADAGEFTFDSGLTSAHVALGGGRFTGSADYTSPDSWTGSLAVSFPGEPNVPLTGPGFSATLENTVLPARTLSAR